MREYLEEIRRENAKREEEREERREKILMAFAPLLLGLMTGLFIWFSI